MQFALIYRFALYLKFSSPANSGIFAARSNYDNDLCLSLNLDK